MPEGTHGALRHVHALCAHFMLQQRPLWCWEHLVSFGASYLEDSSLLGNAWQNSTPLRFPDLNAAADM